MTPQTDKNLAWLEFERMRQPRCVYTSATRIPLCEAQNWRCCYCGSMMDSRPLSETAFLSKRDRRKARMLSATIEHIQRRADGGSDEWENLVAACHWCNVERKDRDALDWFYEVQDLIQIGEHPHF